MLHLVHNPVAGRGRARDAAGVIAAALAGRGVDVRVWTTERPGHATEIASALPAHATVVAIGGDGTAHEVAKACIGSERTMGVVPTGSGDDFSHALGIGRHHLHEAAAVLAQARTRMVDTGICNGEPFVNAIGIGFDAEVGSRVDRAPRPLTGSAAYLWAVGASLRDLSHTSVRVVADGVMVHEGPCLLASCLNGPRTGGSFLFAPHARLDDGLLDVLIAGHVGRIGALGLLPRVIVGRHLGHPRVRHLRAATVEMAWQAPRGWHAEGEVFPARDAFRIEIRPASLRVLGP